ncbi:MAG: flavin reductase family protein [Anaerovoracaceae bacterium]
MYQCVNPAIPGIISREREFVINLTTEELAFAADCAESSPERTSKFKEMKLTPLNCSEVSCPMIVESPINLECKVREIHEYPTHDMFVAEIVEFT